jgi:alpha-beta hydrolase superfamily lysophospholipase
MNVIKSEMYRPSSSGRRDVFSRVWAPETESVRAIVQIAHGMAEYSWRYDEFACMLAQKGFLVCANDHLGHGNSAEPGEKGYFAPKDGYKHVVKDMKSLMDTMRMRFPQAPRFLMGHSMGSFLARYYASLYGESLQGAIFCGTSGPNKAAGAGKAIARLQMCLKGGKSQGRMLDTIAFGGYNKKIENPRSKFSWLTRDAEREDAYVKDPMCGFTFTAGGFYDLMSLLQEVSSKKWAASVPSELPILLVAGQEDPVGNYGKGVEEVHRRLKESGHQDLELKLYPGARHELLNEINRQQVMEDLLCWLESILAR